MQFEIEEAEKRKLTLHEEEITKAVENSENVAMTKELAQRAANLLQPILEEVNQAYLNNRGVITSSASNQLALVTLEWDTTYESDGDYSSSSGKKIVLYLYNDNRVDVAGSRPARFPFIVSLELKNWREHVENKILELLATGECAWASSHTQWNI